MAGSRLEKIGTIYSRTTGLIRAGALKWEDRPLWYDIYEAFPPKEEPRFDRPAPNMKLKQIFYPEDKIRAMFHKNNKQIGATNMFNNKYKTLTQQFIDIYKVVEKQYDGESTSEQIYKEAIDVLKRERDFNRDVSTDGSEMHINLSSAFKEAKENQTTKVAGEKPPSLNINVKDILKD